LAAPMSASSPPSHLVTLAVRPAPNVASVNLDAGLLSVDGEAKAVTNRTNQWIAA